MWRGPIFKPPPTSAWHCQYLPGGNSVMQACPFLACSDNQSSLGPCSELWEKLSLGKDHEKLNKLFQAKF